MCDGDIGQTACNGRYRNWRIIWLTKLHEFPLFVGQLESSDLPHRLVHLATLNKVARPGPKRFCRKARA